MYARKIKKSFDLRSLEDKRVFRFIYFRFEREDDFRKINERSETTFFLWATNFDRHRIFLATKASFREHDLRGRNRM